MYRQPTNALYDVFLFIIFSRKCFGQKSVHLQGNILDTRIQLQFNAPQSLHGIKRHIISVRILF